MEKKNYQKPDMRVVMMKYHSYLLQGTGTTPTPGPGSNDSRSYRMDDDE